ncbi:MAG TPA: LON peptidase substrate-binding domain-containing protein [Xanthobacteraceae bacterium]
MPMNPVYRSPADLPAKLAVFPLAGALLLPRGELPLNIFEPRYLAMIDDALKAERLIGMIQPDESKGSSQHPELFKVGCAGRITQLAESGDGRYLLTLTGIARFRILEELAATTAYRQCRVDFAPFAGDFVPQHGEEAVDRPALMRTLKAYLEANRMEADWSDIKNAPTEALVNGLSMMSPYGAREKQALLEAPDLKTRAETLIAVTEMALATRDGSETPLQ